MQGDTTPEFFLIAGEASGDLLGARLMRALKDKTGGKVRFSGVGGVRMQAEGMEILFPQSELAHMGLFELVRHIPHLLRRIRQTVAEVRCRRPAALITIDSPDFCFRVAKRLRKEEKILSKREGIPLPLREGLGEGCIESRKERENFFQIFLCVVHKFLYTPPLTPPSRGGESPCTPLIHYVAPSVWAWRAGRAKKVAKFLDHLLALLPFEPPYFTREGLACTFVGHPLVESEAGRGDAARFRARHVVADDARILVVLPGSRCGEVMRLLPIFGETVTRLCATDPSLRVVIPVADGVASLVREVVRAWPGDPIIALSDEDKYDALAAGAVGLACSGTVSVELAMAGLPSVVAYKINPLTAAIYRRLIRMKYATLINIMKNREIMPEFIQERCTPVLLEAEVRRLLENPEARHAMKSELSDLATWLGRGQFIPSERAATVVLKAARKDDF